MRELEVVNCGEDPAKYSREELGGKALGLMDLFNIQDEFGFKVPPFFTIPTAFYRDYWRRHGLGDKIKVSSCEDINAINREDKTYMPFTVPLSIREQFSKFAACYSDLITPALFKLSGTLKRLKSEIKFRRKYPEFLKTISQSMSWEFYQLTLDAYMEDERFPDFKHDLEERREANNWFSTIYRSSHPLEDGQFSFAGVFDSIGDQPADLINQYNLGWVLAGAFNPYAQYYAEAHGIKDFNREMAVIIQLYVSRNPDFAGQIHVLPGKTAIGYESRKLNIASFWVETEGGSITRYEGRDKKHRIPGSGPFSGPGGDGYTEVPAKRLEDDYLLWLADLSERVTRRIGQKAQNYEFVVNGDQLYFVQRRPDYIGAAIEGKTQKKPIKNVEESKVVTRNAWGIFSGDFSGPFINMIRYSEGDKPEWRDIKKLTPAQVSELDKKYPGAIYFVDTGQFFNIPGQEGGRYTRDRNPNLFHMLTPNKKGVIFAPGHITGHMDVIYIQDRIFFCVARTPQDLESITEGETINITCNGRDAIIYRD